MTETSEYLLTAIQNNLSALRELGIIDQSGLRKTMATLRLNIEIKEKHDKLIKLCGEAKNVTEDNRQIRNVFNGIKIQKN